MSGSHGNDIILVECVHGSLYTISNMGYSERVILPECSKTLNQPVQDFWRRKLLPSNVTFGKQIIGTGLDDPFGSYSF